MFSWKKKDKKDKKDKHSKDKDRDRADSTASRDSRHSPMPVRRVMDSQGGAGGEMRSESLIGSSRSRVASTVSSGDVKSHTLDRNKSTYDVDIMISYSHHNRPFIRKLQESLECRNLTVWVDEIGQKAGMDFLNKIGQAIIDSKCFVCLLSPEYIKSKSCQDELALAQVYNKPIFPCTLNKPDELFPKMNAGMKLQLARFQWTLFSGESKYDKKVDILVKNLRAVITQQELQQHPRAADTRAASSTSDTQDGEGARRPGTPENSNYFTSYSNSFKQDQSTKNFWMKHFEDKQSVSWPEFYKEFIEEYRDQLTSLFDAKERDWLISIVMRSLDVHDPVMSLVTRRAFDEFCRVQGREVPFFGRVQDQAVESYAMQEVFSMESFVRIEAIENLGKFRSAAVVSALLNLLQDGDNNVRAVAAISLARSGEASDKIVNALLKTLSDKDRLVRESGCLALGHLKVKDAVPQILHLWRNDFISHVREAAQVALEQIGGEEAEKAIHITKVLSEEIRILVQEQNVNKEANL